MPNSKPSFNKGGRPRGRRPTVRPPRLQPVQLATRISRGTRDKLDHYLAWINDPETYNEKAHSTRTMGYSLKDLESLPRSIAQVTEQALANYLADLLTERKDGKLNPQERSFADQHPEAVDPNDKRFRRVGARIPATPRSKPNPNTDLRV